MKNKTTLSVVLAASAVAIVALYAYRGGEKAIRNEVETVATPEPVADTTPDQPIPAHKTHRTDPAVAMAYAMLNKGSSMRSTLDQVVGPGGKVNSAGLATLIQSTDAACSDVKSNAAHYLGTAQQRDNSRRWATERLVEICHEFDPNVYQFDFPKDGLTRVLHEQGGPRAVDASLMALKKESNPSELYSAGQILLEQDRSRLDALLPDGGRDYGDEEVMKAWALATTLLACDEAGGCGPKSLQTAAFCANMGCRSGSDFSQALRQRLPETEYRAVNSFYRWIASQRRI